MNEYRRSKQNKNTYRANGNVWISKEEKLVYTRDNDRSEDAEYPGSQCSCRHIGIICVGDGGAYFGVRGFIFCEGVRTRKKERGGERGTEEFSIIVKVWVIIIVVVIFYDVLGN